MGTAFSISNSATTVWSEKWGYSISRDVRYIAYPPKAQRGCSIWLLDLGNALAQADGRRE